MVFYANGNIANRPSSMQINSQVEDLEVQSGAVKILVLANARDGRKAIWYIN